MLGIIERNHDINASFLLDRLTLSTSPAFCFGLPAEASQSIPST
jgi:hypothetical protein